MVNLNIPEMRGIFLSIRNVCISVVTCLSAVTSCAATSTQAEGQQIFSTTCAACHGLDGHGGEHAPDIATSAKIRALTDEQFTALVRHGIPGAGMPAFGESLKAEQIDAVIRHLRVLQNQSGPSTLPGDPVHGRQVFSDLSCSSCHLVNAQGGFIGPELSGYGKIHNEAEIRQAILDPNRSFDTRHAMAEVSTRRGKVVKGIIRNEDNFSIQLQSLDGDFHLLRKADLASISRQPRSLMPDDYGSRISAKDLNDLIAFMITVASDKPSVNQVHDDN